VDDPLSTEVLHALSDPVRIAALVALEAREHTHAELAAALGIGEPELRAHLHLLDMAGLTTTSATTHRVSARSSGWAAVARRLQRLQDDSAG
jgi:DNA-binding transcriptional ArsR family regulator